MRNNIPHNWIEARTGELFEMVGGGTPSTKTSEYWNGDTPWITSADILEDHRITPRRTVSTRGIAESAANKVPVGTLIVATRVGLGKAAVAEAPMCFSQDCQGLIVPGKRLDSGFLVYQIETITSEFIRQSQGTTIRGITKKALADLKLRIAPTQEQHRIVEAIESYLTRLDEAVASLERVQKNLERYRASVLKAAVEGRLVPTEAELAKKEGRSYEPASELLKRILAERRKKWIENAAEKARAKAEEKTRKTGQSWTRADNVKTLEKERAKAARKYKEPAVPDTSNLPNLPEGWCWATADQLAYRITDGEHQTPPRTDSGVPLISARNVLNGRLSLEDVDYISEKTHQQLCRRLAVSPGDVLLSCSGTVGRACVAPADVEFSMVRSAAVLMPALPMGPFMVLSLRSPILQAQIQRKKTQTAQANIFQGKIKQLVFPLPSLAEQDCIVESAEIHLGLATRADKEIAKASARCARLRQSILKWAFEGKLVDQDPNDLPASVLLEQIKAEREAMEPRKRRRSNKKKNEPVKHDGQLDLLGGSNK